MIKHSRELAKKGLKGFYRLDYMGSITKLLRFHEFQSCFRFMDHFVSRHIFFNSYK